MQMGAVVRRGCVAAGAAVRQPADTLLPLPSSRVGACGAGRAWE